MTEGLKFDVGKLRMDLIPAETLIGLSEVLTYGAEKYGDNNWKAGINYSRIYGAILRHLVAWRKGEILDIETNLPHLYHALCELMFLAYYEDWENDYATNFNDLSYGAELMEKTDED